MNDNSYSIKPVSKTVYKNICVKSKNSDDIFDVGCIISSNENYYNKKDYQIISRFYKIHSIEDMISVDYILKILKKKFPVDISYKIIESYLRNNISFKSLASEKTDHKITIDIKYSAKLYQKNTIYNSFLYNNHVCNRIITKITDNFVELLNNNNFSNINNIFCLKNDPEIDFCVIHKIKNCKDPFYGWGMYLDKQITWNVF